MSAFKKIMKGLNQALEHVQGDGKKFLYHLPTGEKKLMTHDEYYKWREKYNKSQL